jgi:glyoxylase-like metal-dependent hydrolase (beta-lactamase superfamily II)
MHDLANAPEISTTELANRLEAGDAIQVVDVRAPMRVQTGRIDIGPDHQFHNIVGSQLIQMRDVASIGLDPRVPVAVVCGRGNDSRMLAQHLNYFGYDARSVAGGMLAWMRLTLPRELAPPPTADRLVQFDRIGKGALGYLLVSDGEALAVDPPRDTSAYLAAAEDAGARIVGVADTHVHADYISGSPALARSLGVPYYLHPADAVYPYDGTPGRLDFEPLDGRTITVGRSNVTAVHTPGHTEGSVSFVIDDAVALTGDFLFVASVGRPDLAGKVLEWTAQLWNSVTAVKASWKPGVMIHPAHYGTEAERRSDNTVGEPFGHLLETNAALAMDGRDAFVSWVEGKASSFPDAYREIKAVNVGLSAVDDARADELEAGRNECALGGS